MEGISIMPGSIRPPSANCAAAIGLKGATGCQGKEEGEGEPTLRGERKKRAAPKIAGTVSRQVGRLAGRQAKKTLLRVVRPRKSRQDGQRNEDDHSRAHVRAARFTGADSITSTLTAVNRCLNINASPLRLVNSLPFVGCMALALV